MMGAVGGGAGKHGANPASDSQLFRSYSFISKSYGIYIVAVIQCVSSTVYLYVGCIWCYRSFLIYTF